MTKTIWTMTIAAILVAGLLAPAFTNNVYAVTQVITLKSGNAPVGNTDPQITMLSKGSVGPFGPLTATDFAAADAGPNAWVVSPHPAYKPHLTSNPTAEWISTTTTKSPITALYSQQFNVDNCRQVTSADLRISVLVDNQLGDISQEGVFINGNPVIGTKILGVIASNFQIDQNLGPFDVTSLVSPGANHLYTYMQDNGVVGALQYSATLTIDCLPPNEAPVCTGATASQDMIWHPNHKFVPISILGVTDADEGDTLSIEITGIQQDEEVNAKGDGKTSPDGKGVGTDSAEVRAERSGTGDGRIYEISFTADDGNGGECTGSVQVGVPHDKKDTPIDSIVRYDSTIP